ncbi:MAG: hypothetical protein NTY74_03720 [Ignavibacteriae bacterium]|nr:hypothetical protein [Ignavibacteriota bacterium]
MKTIKTNSYINYIISLVILFAIILACGKSKDQSTNSNSNTKSEDSPSITVSASQLYSDYDANEVSADNKYKGKILKVSGTVGEIRKDFTNDIIVELKVGDIFKKIDCTFGKEATETANLSKGQNITVIGTCSGFLIKSVQLKKCRIQ